MLWRVPCKLWHQCEHQSNTDGHPISYPVNRKTIRNWLAELKTKHANEILLEKHFNDLVEAAKVLSENIEKIKSLSHFLEYETPLGWDATGMEGNIIDGGTIGIKNANGTITQWSSDDSQDVYVLISVDDFIAACLLEHYKDPFPKTISFNDWHEVNAAHVIHEIGDKLKLLALSRNFKACSNCPVCNELVT